MKSTENINSSIGSIVSMRSIEKRVCENPRGVAARREDFEKKFALNDVKVQFR